MYSNPSSTIAKKKKKEGREGGREGTKARNGGREGSSKANEMSLQTKSSRV
jgi:hypothetical protein